MQKIQMRLHRQYGHGLKDLAEPLTGRKFSLQTHRGEEDPATGGSTSGGSGVRKVGATEIKNDDGTSTINGLTILTSDW